MSERRTDQPAGMREQTSWLSQFVTEARMRRFREVLALRTRHLTIVLEDIFQPHNASAVLRSCECFGIQDVHIIENRNRYQVNPDVALGSSKWLTLHQYHQSENNTGPCLETLKKKGYRLVATTPHKNGHTPEELPLDEKTALLFGTELHGLGKEALAMADGFVRIPMAGFTESLNISVSAATLLYVLTRRLRHSPVPWQLNQADHDEVLLSFLISSIPNAGKILEEYQRKKNRGLQI